MRTRGTFRGKWPGILFEECLKSSETAAREPFKAAWQNTPKRWSTLKRMQYLDLMTALPDNLLVKLDRMLMGWGLEGRVPFLDHRVVEFGLSLPDSLKVKGKHGKFFLKSWATRFLPENYVFSPKRGFHVPVGEWLSKGSMLDRLGNILPEHPAIYEWFRPEGVKQVIQTCRKPNGTATRILWSLLQFAVWYGIFIRDKGQCPPVLTDPVAFIS
jgi:asparagine synthase (glutamine-hydrolysing)